MKSTLLLTTCMVLTVLFCGGCETRIEGAPITPKVAALLLSDRNWTQKLEFDSPSPFFVRVFGSSGADIVRFVDRRIKVIELDPTAKCGKKAIACLQHAVDPNRILLTPLFFSARRSRVDRVATVVHESRHSDPEHNGYEHALCPLFNFRDEDGNPVVSHITGKSLAGGAACDHVALGSYGITVVLLGNIGWRCKECSIEDRDLARHAARDQLARITRPAARAQLLADLPELAWKVL